jgi:glyoxylase-like metal-dependent hydrolase (beta-lactamase superfamily II)
MFLTTRDGVVLVDAPPTIGHNLLRAIGAVTQANGRPSQVTHLVYSHSHADHIGASVLFGPDVVRIGHSECRTLLLRDDDPNRPPPEVTFFTGIFRTCLVTQETCWEPFGSRTRPLRLPGAGAQSA